MIKKLLTILTNIGRNAVIVALLVCTALLTFGLWLYLRLFACWAELEDWSSYLCEYDFLLLLFGYMQSNSALYFLFQPVTKTETMELRVHARRTILSVLLGLVIASSAVAILLSPIIFPMFY